MRVSHPADRTPAHRPVGGGAALCVAGAGAVGLQAGVAAVLVHTGLRVGTLFVVLALALLNWKRKSCKLVIKLNVSFCAFVFFSRTRRKLTWHTLHPGVSCHSLWAPAPRLVSQHVAYGQARAGVPVVARVNTFSVLAGQGVRAFRVRLASVDGWLD